MIRDIFQDSDPILHISARRIDSFDIAKNVSIDLVDTMRERALIGLAAPQIGQNYQIFITEIRPTITRKPKELDELRIYVNPEIISKSKDVIEMWEGCGSVGNGQIFGKVQRPREVSVQYQDISGTSRMLHATGLLARVIQHEYDHLLGKLFPEYLDKASLISRDEYLKLAGD